MYDSLSQFYYHFEVADFAGIPYAIISATGYTGSGGFEIYCKNSEAEQVWDKVFEAGAPYGVQVNDFVSVFVFDAHGLRVRVGR